MATTTIADLPAYLLADLPSSRALDYKAMFGHPGAGLSGEWCLYAFSPFRARERSDRATVNFYQTTTSPTN